MKFEQLKEKVIAALVLDYMLRLRDQGECPESSIKRRAKLYRSTTLSGVANANDVGELCDAVLRLEVEFTDERHALQFVVSCAVE